MTNLVITIGDKDEEPDKEYDGQVAGAIGPEIVAMMVSLIGIILFFYIIYRIRKIENGSL